MTQRFSTGSDKRSPRSTDRKLEDIATSSTTFIAAQIRLVEEAAAMANERAKEELERRIRDRAYRIWLDEGQPDGKYLEHWLRAKREVEEEEAIVHGTEDLKSE